MKSRFFLPILGLVACAGCSGGNPGTTIARTGGPAGLDRVCETLSTFVTEEAAPGKVRGYAFTLFDESGTLLDCAAGTMTPGAVRPIASASKLAAAAAILTLVDSGRLNLDLPVSLYLLGSGVNWPLDKLLITTRMLLNHTSGIPGLGDESSPECVEDETTMTLQECVAQIADTPLVSRPGQAFNYGGASFQVAGFIATRIANQSWQDFFETAIGQPLGMTTFTYGPPDRVTNPRIAGGANSNVQDYARLLQMIQGGGQYQGTRILSQRMVDNMLTDQIGRKEVTFAPVDPAKYPGYSFGFFHSDPSLHPGSAGPELSDPGLFGATPWIDQDLKYGAVILILKGTPMGLAMWDAVRPIIIQELGGT